MTDEQKRYDDLLRQHQRMRVALLLRPKLEGEGFTVPDGALAGFIDNLKVDPQEPEHTTIVRALGEADKWFSKAEVNPGQSDATVFKDASDFMAQMNATNDPKLSEKLLADWQAQQAAK